jgi:hypothetical protein
MARKNHNQEYANTTFNVSRPDAVLFCVRPQEDEVWKTVPPPASR